MTLPKKGYYKPGEVRVVHKPNPNKHRPYTWTVEWNGEEGLDFDAYNTTIRSPYIQNVTQNSATVLWRVGIPKNNQEAGRPGSGTPLRF
jgi:hypothetical protein